MSFDVDGEISAALINFFDPPLYQLICFRFQIRICFCSNEIDSINFSLVDDR